jgi:hypothetical protein
LRPGLHGTVVMVLAVSLVKWALLPKGSAPLRLVIEIATGAAAYIGTLALLHRERMMAFLRTARNLRSARPVEA